MRRHSQEFITGYTRHFIFSQMKKAYLRRRWLGNGVKGTNVNRVVVVRVVQDVLTYLGTD